MSFSADINNSFGNYAVEDSNVVLSSPHQNDMNISFEDNKNNNNNADIFNAIKTNIQPELLDVRNTFYKTEYTIERISSSLLTLHSILSSHINNIKLYSFLHIKHFSLKHQTQLIKAQMLYLKISQMLTHLLRLRRKKTFQLKSRRFFFWKEKVEIIKKVNEAKDKLELSLEKQNNEELNKLTKRKNEIDIEVKNLNERVSTLQKEENDLKKKVKAYEDNERVLQDKVKVLGDKKTKNKELLNNKRKLINSNSNNNALSSNVNVNSNDISGLEMTIKDLKNQITMIEDKKRERMNTINSFFAEMNVLLQEHEQKCKDYFI